MPLQTAVSPFVAPNYDVFSPARLSDDRGVVVGAPLDGAQSYTPWIGLTTVRELALKHQERVGLVEREKLNDLKHQLAVANEQNARLAARVEELEALQGNITGLVKAGFKVTKAVGRPPKKEG